MKRLLTLWAVVLSAGVVLAGNPLSPRQVLKMTADEVTED